jgi:hypothetical protein
MNHELALASSYRVILHKGSVLLRGKDPRRSLIQGRKEQYCRPLVIVRPKSIVEGCNPYSKGKDWNVSLF